jgi:O-antigen/teichoic acid export membrane protein
VAIYLDRCAIFAGGMLALPGTALLVTKNMNQDEQPKTESFASRNPIAANMAFGFLSWVLPGLVAFFSTPIVVTALGPHDFGLYALIFGFISYSVSFSIGKGVTKYVAEYKPAGNYEKINDVLSATLFLCLLIGLGAALFLIGGSSLLVRDAVQIAPADQAKSITSFYLAAAVIFFYTLSQVFSAVLTGLHRFDIYSYVTTFYGVLLASGNITLAMMGFGIVELFWWCLFTNIVICVVYFICAKRLLPEMKIKLNFHRETLALVFKYSSGVILGQIFANILLLFERGLITRTLGAEFLTYYAVPMTLAIYIHSFVGSLIMVIFPKASELGAQQAKQITLYERTTKVVVTMVAFIAVTMIAASHIFLYRWVGVQIADNGAPAFVLLVLIFSLLAVGGITWQLAEGLGHTRYNALLTFSWLAISAVLMLLLIGPWGIFGVGFARLMGVLTIPASILYIEHWLLGGVRWRFWVKLLSVLFVATAAAGLTEWLVFKNMAVSWLTLFAGGAAGIVVYTITLFIFGWWTNDEKELFSRLVFRASKA